MHKSTQSQSFIPATKDAFKLMHDGILALSQIEDTGMLIDVPYCKQQYELIDKKAANAAEKLKTFEEYKLWENHFGLKMNTSSDKQLRTILFDVMKLQATGFTKKGDKEAVDKNALHAIGSPFVNLLLKMREYHKIRDTYLGGLLKEQVNGVLHPHFNLHTVVTYRSSSSAINFQNQPNKVPTWRKVIRRAFIPRPGHFFGGVDYCFIGTTSIETVNGPVTLQEIYEKQLTPYVYCYDKANHRTAVSRVTASALTQKQVEVWRIVLDNDKEIIGTPDHGFLKRNEDECKVRDLQPGDSLMPFYKKVEKDRTSGVLYDKIYLNNGSSMKGHALVALDIFGIDTIKENKIVHHKNSNGRINDPSNLEVMTRAEHMSFHAKQGWVNKGVGRNRTAWNKSEANRQKTIAMNARRKQEWTEDDWFEFGQRVKEAHKRTGYTKQNTQNPMYGKTHTAETLSKISKKRKEQGRLGNPETWRCSEEAKQKISKANKGRVAYNKGVKTGPLPIATRMKMSNAHKGKVMTPEQKRTISKKKQQYWESKQTEVCAICGGAYRSISNTHLAKHNISKKEYNETYNHKVKSIEFYGYEDVYNVTVEKHHNYALSAGVIVKNCGIEVKIAYCYHKDENMKKYLYDTTTDMHRDVAMDCYKIPLALMSKPIRSAGKNAFTFPQFYGDYFINCAKNLWNQAHDTGVNPCLSDGKPLPIHLKEKGLNTLEKFTDHIQEVERVFWEERFADYGQWKKDWVESYTKKGYFHTHTGFTCQGLMAKNDVINYPVQGSAFHCMLWSLIQIHKWLQAKEMKTKIVGQIHDEIVLDVHADETDEVFAYIKYIMCDHIKEVWPWIISPMEIDGAFCDVGETWYDKKPVKF